MGTGDLTFQAPLSALNANLDLLKSQLGLNGSNDVSDTIGSRVTQARNPSMPTGGPSCSVRFGTQLLPFPNSLDYENYVDFFFNDINPNYPCVNEGDFRQKSKNLPGCPFPNEDDTCFLALNYIVFACSDILRDIDTAQDRAPRPGWDWFLAADTLVGKRKLSGQADLCLIQFLIFEVRIMISAFRGAVVTNEPSHFISYTRTSRARPITPSALPVGSVSSTAYTISLNGERTVTPTPYICVKRFFGLCTSSIAGFP